MALQTSPPISMQDIATEFGLSLPKSLQELAVAAGVSGPPYSLLDFLGLSAITFVNGDLQAQLLAADRAESDNFGRSVAISRDGNTLAIGASGVDSPNLNEGAVYVFVRSGTTWTQQAKLADSNSGNGDSLAIDLSISDDGNTILASAYNHDGAAGSNSGKAVVFARSGTTWNQQSIPTPNDITSSDFFGYAVDLSGDGNIAVVSSRENENKGSAYVFIRSGTTWTQVSKLVALDGEAGDRFGESVAMSTNGNYIIVGATLEDGGGVNSGAAYIFLRSGGNTWNQQAKLLASGAPDNGSDTFGDDVDIDDEGTTVIIGARAYDAGDTSNSGAAYIFTRSGFDWTEQTRLEPPVVTSGGNFGEAVSISGDGDFIVIGEPNGNGGTGSAYTFSRSNGTWTLENTLLPNVLQSGDLYGRSVSLSKDAATTAISAYGLDNPTSGEGAVFIYV